MKITGNEDLGTPIFFLFVYALMLGLECGALSDNLNSFGSIILNKPIFFDDSLLKTSANFFWFFIPAAILWEALKEKQVFLKCTYTLGAIPFILTASVISKLGYKILYGIKIAILFLVIMLLMKYSVKISELYKSAFLERGKDKLPDNQVAPPDDSQARRP